MIRTQATTRRVNNPPKHELTLHYPCRVSSL